MYFKGSGEYAPGIPKRGYLYDYMEICCICDNIRDNHYLDRRFNKYICNYPTTTTPIYNSIAHKEYKFFRHIDRLARIKVSSI